MINIKKITLEDNNNKNINIQKEIFFNNKNNLNKKNQRNSPIFYISKFHKRICSHSNSKTKKNHIKKMVFKDFLTIKKAIEKNSIKSLEENILITDKKYIGKNNFEELIKVNNQSTNNYNKTKKEISNYKLTFENSKKIYNSKSKFFLKNDIPKKSINKTTTSNFVNSEDCFDENIFLKKKTTNRNFRLFDKDVVIKKIMSNFMKFLKLIIEIYLQENHGNFHYEIKKKLFEEIFSNVQKCKEFLYNKKISNFIITKKTNSTKKFHFSSNVLGHNINEIFLKLNLIELYKTHFLNSDFLVNYIFPKIKKDHDKSYYKHFTQYLKKLHE